MAKGKNIPLMTGMSNHQSKAGSEHWEKPQSEMGGECDLRYTDKPNPQALKESQDKLASYVKKNQMKY
jgi:hypothetical protein